MAEDLTATLQSLLAEDLELNHTFMDHLNFARNMVGDENVKLFFSHMMEEEQEHLQKLEALVSRAKGLPAHTVAEPVAGSSDSKGGHYQRRDQNILTVGSLIGLKQ